MDHSSPEDTYRIETTLRIIGAIVKRRKELGLTQKELAKKCGVTQARISHLEGSPVPQMNTLLKVCYALGLKINID